jgi:hypothetical protein
MPQGLPASRQRPASEAHQPPGKKVGDDDEDDAYDEHFCQLVFVDIVEHRIHF